MAYIYKRGKKWAFRAYAGKDPITGKDKQKSKSGFRTRKDAEMEAAKFERQFHSGEYIETSKITFAQAMEEWEKHYSVDAKESSLRARNKALKHACVAFGGKPIQRITKQEYQSFIDEISNKFSRNYVSSIHTSSNMVFEYAQNINLIKSVPSEKIKLPKKRKTVDEIENASIQDKFLEKKELHDFLLRAKVQGLESDLLMFTTLGYTGLRVGELLALKWSDVGLDAHTLRVTKTYYNPNNNKKKYQLLTPKTDKSIRTISIDDVVVSLLDEHKRLQDEIKTDNPFYKDENFIFATNEGYPKTLRHVGLRMKRLLDMTDIDKNVTPHSFRHSHTSLLIEANVHIKEIQERLGHASLETTMEIYAHITEDIKKEASTKFGNLMDSLSDKLKT